MNDYIKQLKEDPLVYYIYQIDLSIFNIPDDIRYLIIVDNKYNKPDLSNYKFYDIDEWFKMVLDNNILTWICSCLPKKFIIKEHVKLTIPYDTLKIRHNIIRMLKESIETENPDYFGMLLYIKLANQLIENHKIINYNEFYNDYINLQNSNNFDTYKKLSLKPLEFFHKATDGLYKQNLINKLN